MEYKDIKIGDVVLCSSVSGKRGVVTNKCKGRITLITADARDYFVHPNECASVIKNVKIKAILEAIIN